MRDYLLSHPACTKDHTVLRIISFLARVQVDRNSCSTHGAEACMRAGSMNGAPHIKILNQRSSDNHFGSRYAVEVEGDPSNPGLRSFDSEDTRDEIQRSMPAREREKHVKRLERGLSNWNLAQENGTGPLNITQMIIQKKDLCDIYIVCSKINGRKKD